MRKFWIAATLALAVSAANAGAPSLSASPRGARDAAQSATQWREVTIPAGTILKVNLRTSVGSDTSRVEDPVRGTLRSPVSAGGITALPAGTALSGYVTDATRSARVKGRAHIAFRFTRIDPPGPDDSATIRTATVSRIAPGTKKRDAATIGGGAVGGAIVGGIVGGGDGAAKGAAIGGAGGTGVVLATRGKEVRMASGTPVSVRLSQALTVRVPLVVDSFSSQLPDSQLQGNRCRIGGNLGVGSWRLGVDVDIIAECMSPPAPELPHPRNAPGLSEQRLPSSKSS